MRSIPADQLATSDLDRAAWAYRYELEKLESLYGEGGAREMLEAKVVCALEITRVPDYTGPRYPAYLVWVAVGDFNSEDRHMMVVSYFVSPCGEESADGQDGDNDDPFVGVMLSVDGFIKSEVASPIWESAVPVLQYRAGETVRVELTREFLKTAMEIADELEVPNLQSRLFGDVNPHLNLYRALLATYE